MSIYLFREKTEYARSASQEKFKQNITSYEAYLNEHSLPVEIMKSTDNETVIKL
jgi:predicted enzyme involved in methoxymalonyl-ACP biosynthesis